MKSCIISLQFLFKMNYKNYVSGPSSSGGSSSSGKRPVYGNPKEVFSPPPPVPGEILDLRTKPRINIGSNLEITLVPSSRPASQAHHQQTLPKPHHPVQGRTVGIPALPPPIPPRIQPSSQPPGKPLPYPYNYKPTYMPVLDHRQVSIHCVDLI